MLVTMLPDATKQKSARTADRFLQSDSDTDCEREKLESQQVKKKFANTLTQHIAGPMIEGAVYTFMH